MVVHERILVDLAEDVASRYVVSDLGKIAFNLNSPLDVHMRHTLKFIGSKSQESDLSRASVLIPLGI